ncbi:tetratricopeptide repeat-containing diguanylate cyclase [Alteromonas sp. S015]|uniref:tetratricopeptide repeat-containing diguanylate cyclase n=1 Tax=Alteromonas sp. S015 TaxID=3117401 RepID=UPI002FDF78A3
MKLLLSALFTLFVFLSGLSQAQSVSPDDVVQAREKGKLDFADSTATTLLAYANDTNNTSLQADALYQLGRNAMERNNYTQAHQWLNQANRIYLDLNDELSTAKTYRQIGLTYRYQSDYATALEYLYMAMAIFQRNGSEQDLSSINNSLGVVLEKMGQFNEAAAHHQLALEIDYELNDETGIASGLYNLGDIRRVLGDYEQALEYFRQALALDEASGKKKNIAYSTYKVGYVSMQLGQYKDAAQYMQRAHALFTEIDAVRDIDWALSGLSELALKKGKLTEAKSLAIEIIGRAEKYQYKSLMLDVYHTLIEIYVAQKQYNEALALIEKAIELAESTEESHQISQLLAKKANALEMQVLFQDAYETLKRQKQLDDALFNKRRMDALASTQAQTEFIRRANQIALLEQRQVLQKIQAKNERDNRRNLFLGVLVLVLMAFLLYYRHSQQKYMQKLEHEVALRTAELKSANEGLEALSLTDKLTGLNNRRFVESQIDADITSVLRKHQQTSSPLSSKDADLCLFVIDIDKFKRINDTFGHIAGDEVLQQMAKRLKRIFRDSDFVVRWGGEEFVAVARFINRNDAEALAERIVDDIQRTPFALGDSVNETITCSVGFSCFPFSCKTQSYNTMLDIFTVADHCLYAAKGAGRNKWVGILDIADTNILPIPSSIPALKALEGKQVLTLSLKS